MSKQRMPQRLIPVVRFLESVLKDERATMRMKMEAAGRLSDLMLSAERTKERAAVAMERAQARAREAEQGKASPEAPDEPTGQPDAMALPQEGTSVKQSVDEYLQRTIRNASSASSV